MDDIQCPFCKVSMRETAGGIYICPDCDSQFKPTSKWHGIAETWREQQRLGSGKSRTQNRRIRKKPAKEPNPWMEI